MQLVRLVGQTMSALGLNACPCLDRGLTMTRLQVWPTLCPRLQTHPLRSNWMPLSSILSLLRRFFSFPLSLSASFHFLLSCCCG